MAKTLKDLLLALLNATLILLAICLFFGWKLVSSLDNVTDRVSQNLERVQPLMDEAQGIRSDLGALRGDLQALRTGDAGLTEAAQERLESTLTRLDGVSAKLETAQERMSQLAESPEGLIDHAINTSADAIASRVIDIRGCVAPEAPAS